MNPSKHLARRWTDIGAVGGLLGLAALLFRSHLARQTLFVGNFDRLNTFLNTLRVETLGWPGHHSGAWDDTMFMGRNIFALPFTYPNALNYLVALFPPSQFYWIAGYISIGLLGLSATTAYLFLRDLCRDRYAAFVGATLYEFSALSTLKVTQNDMSFAVLIHIPLLLWLIRAAQPGRVGRTFVALCAVLTHLFIFCFLQKVAYAMLLTGAYALFWGWRRRSWLPVTLVVTAAAIAALAAFPRIYGIARELRELRRIVAPGFDMNNFDALYHWQNYKHYDVLRWFQDGLFGRYYSEKNALGNDLNITEGMLLYTGPMVPFIILGSLVRWRGRWLGLFLPGESESLFFVGMVALAIAVIVSKPVYHLFFELFLRMDFTHTRIVIAALLPLCGLISLFLAHARQRWGPPSPDGRLAPGWALGAAAVALGLSFGLTVVGDSVRGADRFALTSSWSDFLGQSRLLLTSLANGRPFAAMPLKGELWVWMKTAVVVQVCGYALLGALGALAFGLLGWTRMRASRVGLFMVLMCGDLLVTDAFRYADFQINDSHVRSRTPFASSNSYMPAADEFSPPTREELASVHARLERDAYRTVLLTRGDPGIPPFVAPHIGAFWGLRLVEGYSSGVPVRLGSLPWSPQVLGLRTMTFARMDESTVQWRLLAWLNVKYGIYIDQPFYKNSREVRRGDGTSGSMPPKIVENPFPPVPRIFFPARIVVVSSLTQDLAAVFPRETLDPVLNPTATTVIEASQPMAFQNLPEDVIRSSFEGDEIKLRLKPSGAARLLVLNELLHPDWHAYSGSMRLRVVPANVVMRGLIVPPGVSEATLRFEPFASVSHLLQSTGLAALLAAVLLFLARRLGPAS
jgi:hypothetical protein